LDFGVLLDSGNNSGRKFEHSAKLKDGLALDTSLSFCATRRAGSPRAMFLVLRWKPAESIRRPFSASVESAGKFSTNKKSVEMLKRPCRELLFSQTEEEPLRLYASALWSRSMWERRRSPEPRMSEQLQ
jgi:hypothetical protein